jgi:hypothetical protein
VAILWIEGKGFRLSLIGREISRLACNFGRRARFPGLTNPGDRLTLTSFPDRMAPDFQRTSSPRRNRLRWSLFLLGGLASLPLAAQYEAGGEATRGLLSRSPFLPPDMPPPTTARPVQAPSPIEGVYEFRGYYAINGEIRVLLKNRQEPNGRWVRLRESLADGTTLASFDPIQRTVVLESGGETVRLALATLGKNPDPLPISGQPNPAQALAANRPPGEGVNTTPTVRRRVVPPRPPQWIRDRMEAQGIDPDNLASNSAGPPSEPPSMVPPPPPLGGRQPPPPPAGIDLNSPPPDVQAFMAAMESQQNAGAAGGTNQTADDAFVFPAGGPPSAPPPVFPGGFPGAPP